MRLSFTAALLLAIFVAAAGVRAQELSSADPLIDRSYGTAGFAAHPQPPYNLGLRAQCTEDHRCTVVRQVTGNGDALEAYRLLQDGSLDLSFGINGVQRLDFGDRWITAFRLQPDGKLLVGGYIQRNLPNSTLDPFVVRFNADGRVDEEFGERGVFATDLAPPGFKSNDLAYDLAVQPDGRIVIAGLSDLFVSTGTTLAFGVIIRLDADGTLDKAFGDSGIFARQLGEGHSNLLNTTGTGKISLQEDGRLVAGFGVKPVFSDPPHFFYVLRITSNGAADPSFSKDGMTVVDSSPFQGFHALRTLSDGKILSLLGNGALIRLDANGGFDPTFGNNGRVMAAAGLLPTDMSVHANGRIVVSAIGTIFSPRRDIGVVRRFFANGGLDTRFGSGGTFSLESIDSDIRFGSIQVVRDEKYYIHTRARLLSTSPMDGQFFTVRLNSRRATKISLTSQGR